MSKQMKDDLCDDWCSVLSKYPLEEVQQGINDVFMEVGGKLRSINEFQVEAAILKEHQRQVSKLPKQAEEPEPERDFSPETVAERRKAANQILKEYGFLKRMNTNEI